MHRFKIKIYYEDTDAAGVVYYANYLRYFERARTEFLFENGIDVAAYHEKGYFFAVVHVDIKYKKPARLGDTIEVATKVTAIKNATISLKQHALKDETLLVEADVKLAFIDKDGRPRRLPAELKKIGN